MVDIVKFHGAVYSLVIICQCCSYCWFSSYVVHVELWFWNLETRSVLSGVPELPSLIPIICCLSSSGEPDTRVTKEFGISTESTMLSNFQSNAQQNHGQLLDSSETDPLQYISNHPGIDRLFKRYRADVLYSETWLAYAGLAQTLQPSIFSLRNEVQTHLESTLWSSLMVSDLTPHAYSIHWPILTSHNSLLTYDPTPGSTLDCVHPLHISLERFILLYLKNSLFFPDCFESVAVSTNRVSSFTHWTFRCRRSSSRLASANIWIFTWSACEGRRLNAITVMLCVNLSFEGRCPPHAYHRCTARDDN